MPELKLERAEDVLTLSEAAAFLRVTEDALSSLAAKDAVPGQKIAGEWRFLKRALADWLRYGHRYRKVRKYPLGMFAVPLAEELIQAIRSVESNGPERPFNQDVPGSKEAVLKHFGAFQDDDDLEARLADARRQREASG
jgi:hypothetical protein